MKQRKVTKERFSKYMNNQHQERLNKVKEYCDTLNKECTVRDNMIEIDLAIFTAKEKDKIIKMMRE